MEVNRKINLPTDLNEIPLRKFIEYRILPEQMDQYERALRAIAIFAGIGYKEVLRMPVGILNKAATIIATTLSQDPPFQDRFELNGVLYGFVPDLDTITTGEFIDIDTYSKNPEDLWKVMSVLYRPITKKGLQKRYEIQPYQADLRSDFLDMPTGIALGAQLFFYTLGTDLLSYIPKLLEGVKTQYQSHWRSKDYQKNMAGLELSTSWLEEISHELIKLRLCPFTRPYCGRLTKRILAAMSEN